MSQDTGYEVRGTRGEAKEKAAGYGVARVRGEATGSLTSNLEPRTWDRRSRTPNLEPGRKP